MTQIHETKPNPIYVTSSQFLDIFCHNNLCHWNFLTIFPVSPNLISLLVLTPHKVNTIQIEDFLFFSSGFTVTWSHEVLPLDESELLQLSTVQQFWNISLPRLVIRLVEWKFCNLGIRLPWQKTIWHTYHKPLILFCFLF